MTPLDQTEHRNDRLDARGKRRVQTFNTEPSMTVQSDRDGADVHKLLSQWSPYGIVQELDKADALYMDITEFQDYADAMLHAEQAKLEFMKLDPRVRELFDNDVAKFLDAAHDREKRQELLDAGIISELGEGGQPEADAPVAEGVVPEASETPSE